MRKLNPLTAALTLAALFSAPEANASFNIYGALTLYKGKVIDVSEVGDGECVYIAEVKTLSREIALEQETAMGRENSIECLSFASEALDETTDAAAWEAGTSTTTFLAPCAEIDASTVHAEGVPFFGYEHTVPTAVTKPLDKASPLIITSQGGDPIDSAFGTFSTRRRGVMVDTTGSAAAMSWVGVARTMRSVVMSGGTTMITNALARHFGDNLDISELPLHLVSTDENTENVTSFANESDDEEEEELDDAALLGNGSGMTKAGYANLETAHFASSSTASEYYLNDRISKFKDLLRTIRDAVILDNENIGE